MIQSSIKYAERDNGDKYVNIEKFVKRFICVTNKINHKESGLFAAGFAARIGLVW